MMREYAVEPKAIVVNWENAKYLLENFGLEQGRLISKFPDDWSNQVLNAAKNWKSVEKLRLIEKLKRVKKVIFSVKHRKFLHRGGQWLEQVLKQHELDPFHAIIVVEKPTEYNPAIVAVSEIEEDHKLFRVDRTQKIQRVGSEIANALEEFLKSAKILLFIDPYFNDLEKYRETLGACLKLLQRDKLNEINCEVHHSNENFGYKMQDRINVNKKVINGVIPQGLSVDFYTWREKDLGEDFHDRYLLTDRGGVTLGAGFSEEGKDENVEITLLQHHVSQRIQQNFTRNSVTYELALPIARVFSDGKAVLIK